MGNVAKAANNINVPLYERTITLTKISDFFVKKNQEKRDNKKKELSYKKYKALIDSIASIIKLEAISMLRADLNSPAGKKTHLFRTYTAKTSTFFPIETSWGQLAMYSNGHSKESWSVLDSDIKEKYKRETSNEIKALKEFGVIVNFQHVSRSKQRILIKRSLVSFAKSVAVTAERAPKQAFPAPPKAANTPKTQSLDFQQVSEVISKNHTPSCNELNIKPQSSKKDNKRSGSANVSNYHYVNEIKTSIEPCVEKIEGKASSRQNNFSPKSAPENKENPIFKDFLKKFRKNFFEKGGAFREEYEVVLPQREEERYAVLLWKSIVDNFYDGVKINRKFDKLAKYQHVTGLELMHQWLKAEIASGLLPQKAFLKLNWCIAKLTHNRKWCGKTYVYGPQWTFAITEKLNSGAFYKVVHEEFPNWLEYQKSYPIQDKQLILEGYGEIEIHRTADKMLKLMQRNRVFDLPKIHQLENNIHNYIQILQDNGKISDYNQQQILIRYTDFWAQIKVEKMLIDVEKSNLLTVSKTANYIRNNVLAYGKILHRIGLSKEQIKERETIFTQQFSFVFKNQNT